MSADLAFQVAGAVAIVVGLAGTWWAARHRSGWLVCVASSALWLPALTTGSQWVAVVNCGLSIAICVRNFLTPPRREPLMIRSGNAPCESGWSDRAPQELAVVGGPAGPDTAPDHDRRP